MEQQLGATLQRLRKAYRLSLGDLSEQSGVAKSIISRIEKNETNPTLATIVKLCEALDKPLGELLLEYQGDKRRSGMCPAMIERAGAAQTPVLHSDDGKCTLTILSWVRIVELVQWYDVHMAPGGIIDSEGHPAGSIENISILSGEVTLETDGTIWNLQKGETIRYQADRPHLLRNDGTGRCHITMVNLLPPVVRLTAGKAS